MRKQFEKFVQVRWGNTTSLIITGIVNMILFVVKNFRSFDLSIYHEARRIMV